MHKKRFLTSLGLIVAVLVFSIAPPVQIANAAALTGMSAVLSSVKVSADADEEIMFITPTGIASGAVLVLTYDSDFSTVDVVFTDIDLSFQATPDGVCTTGDTQMVLVAGAPASASMGFVNTSSTVLTFTNGTTAIDAASEVCILIGTNASGGANTMKNATSANSYNLAFSGDFGDTGTIVITIVTDDVVVTTATVVASLTFTVDGDQTMGFGTLLTGSARWANTTTGSGSAAIAHTMTVGTNSTAGYGVTYNGTALVSGSDKISDSGNTTISGSADGTPGSEQFAIAIATDGNATIPSAYQYGSNNYAFVESITTTLMSETIATDTETISVYYIANIATDTEAHTDYTSSITYIATGNF